jgi:gamma-glutamyltranspeptidase / glutathione hydrolase
LRSCVASFFDAATAPTEPPMTTRRPLAMAIFDYISLMHRDLIGPAGVCSACLRSVLAAALFAAALVHGKSPAPVVAKNGMVVTAQHLATRVGVEVLKNGGNAIDAAVAVGYALAVVYPAAGNLGGGGFMTVMLADGRRAFIDFREKAPLAATRDMYLDASGHLIPNASLLGHRAVAVPGTVAGLEHARSKYGTLSREKLVAPAIALADEGFTLQAGDVRGLAEATRDLANDKPSAAIFLENGHAKREGMALVQKDLASTLREISRNGTAGFYKGRVAEAIVTSNRAGGGILSMEDFAQYAPRELAPVECDYRGLRIVSAPPPSSGGVILCEILQVLEGYPLGELGFRSAEAVHYQIEAMRHAYVDRNGLLGDPDFVKNPLERLLDKAYAARIRTGIDPAKAGSSRALKLGSPPHEGTNTTHYSIIDKAGNAVAVTYTLNESFGARVMAAGTGVLLNNEMDDFTVKLGEANLFGLVQGEPNMIAPGKRPLSSMSPTIVLRGGKPVLILGSPGGGRIITAVLHALINVADYGMNVQEAVDAPRFHQQWLPEETVLEREALAPETRRALEARGHRFREGRAGTLLEAIAIDGGQYFGANDRRGGSGLALGY